jgi:hypothetical protein
MAIHPNSPEVGEPSSRAGYDVILTKTEARRYDIFLVFSGVGSALDGPELSSSTRGSDGISKLRNQQHQVLPTEVCTG